MLDIGHLKDIGQSYGEHMLFALLICGRLAMTTFLLSIHAFLPFLKMPRIFDIARTSDYLFDKDYEVRVRMMKILDKDVSDTE